MATLLVTTLAGCGQADQALSSGGGADLPAATGPTGTGPTGTGPTGTVAAEACVRPVTPHTTSQVPPTSTMTIPVSPPAMTATTPTSEMVMVAAVMPTRAIRRGTMADDAIAAGILLETTNPRDLQPIDAIESFDGVRGKIALFDIPPGVVIIPGMFVDAEGSTGSPIADCPPSDTTIAPQVTMPDGRTPIYVVRRPIRRGTAAADALADGSIVVEGIEMAFRPTTAIVAPSQIIGNIAMWDLAAGTVIVEGVFVYLVSSSSGTIR